MTHAIKDLSHHGKRVESVFDLLGWNENDLTASLGFTLARSPRFVSELLRALSLEAEQVEIRMETRGDDGRTDLEIETPSALVVVEAKRGWVLPTESQLRRYATRVQQHAGERGVLVTLSDCSVDWASGPRGLPGQIAGIPVQHLPWSTVREALARASGPARGGERHWLNELETYLRRAVRVTDVSDMWTYCVVVSEEQFGDRTFRDYVLDEGVYFHPFGWGHGWPKEPPNFLAFRWSNTVQRVHRVMSHEIVESLRARWPDIPPEQGDDPHVIYTLGPPLRFDPIPTGRSYRASRMWLLLDQLMSCATLEEALQGTEALRKP